MGRPKLVWLKWPLRLVLIGAGLLVVATAGLVVWPSVSPIPGAADAIFVLSGGTGDRLALAARLMNERRAPVLVVSDGNPRTKACAARHPYVVICPKPHPANTRGEAEMISRLVKQHGWRRIIVVTSRYHVTRARLLINRCVPGQVSMVASNPRVSRWGWVGHIAHESLGLGWAVTIDRGC